MRKGLFEEAKRIDLLATVQRYTKQEGKGYNTVAFHCLRHKDNSPSLMVNRATGTWHAFCGCSVGGDVVDFTEWAEFGTVSKGAMQRDASGQVDITSNRYRALEILVGTQQSTFVAKTREAFTRQKPTLVNHDDIVEMHNLRLPTLDYFVGQRRLEEKTVDMRVLGTALLYPNWYNWDTKSPERFTCTRYSIPWMRRGISYMVNYRRDDQDCYNQLKLYDPETLYKIRQDIARGTDYTAGDITDEQLIRHMFGDKYRRNKGSTGFTIFNLDRIMVEKWLPYCTINEAEISAISCEESGLNSVAASYKDGIDFAKAFARVHRPIIFADNDGGTGLAKATKLAQAIGNPRTYIQVVPAPFKDVADLLAYDKINHTGLLNSLKREIQI